MRKVARISFLPQGHVRGVHGEHVHVVLLVDRHLLHPGLHGAREGSRDPGRRQERARTSIPRVSRGRPTAHTVSILGRKKEFNAVINLEMSQQLNILDLLEE